MNYLLYGLIWVTVTYTAYAIKNPGDKKDKLKVMSCRSKLRRFKKLNEADSKSIF